MAAKTKVTKSDLKKGVKRVNITLTISEFDKLVLIAEYKGIQATSVAKSLLMPELEKEAKRILVTEKYVPKNQRGLKLL
jgi:hypothetical protein